MSLVLSNAFKGLLLSSYVNIKFDLAVKSLQDLIDKPEIEIILDEHSLVNIKQNTTELNKLLKRSGLVAVKRIQVLSQLEFQSGQAVLLCSSVNCPLFIALNPRLQLRYTEDHLFHSFGCLRVTKIHSHSKQIHKL